MPPQPPGQRPRRQPARYGPPSVEKLLGALPVVADFCRRLDLEGIVDRACPIREVATLTHGQVICALVANRLTSPTPLRRVEDWARAWAVEETFDIPADALNDDRIGRALDAIAPKLERIVGSVGACAIAAFGLDTARLHWDMTSISLYGAYEEVEDGFVAPRFGHPKDRRPDLKQVQTGLGVTGDGGVPVFHRAYDGGAGEVAQVAGAMRALRKLAGQRRFLVVGDSKLVSYANLRGIMAAEVDFIAPASKTYVTAEALAALDVQAAAPVDYLAERDRGKPPDQRGSYRVVEDTMTIAGASVTRRSGCAGCSCGPRPARRRPPPPAPASWTGREVTWSGSPAGWAAATTPTSKRSRRAWPPSPAAAGSPACCAPRSGSTRPPANRPWRGGSTPPRWSASRPPTAGMGC